MAAIAAELNTFVREPYVVGPAGVGVLRSALGNDISIYLSFAYFSKYQALGTYAGFSFPELKAITDGCLRGVGQRLGIVPRFALSNPCPAVLYPLEFFSTSPLAQPFKLDGQAADWARRAILQDVLLSWSWVTGRHELLQFLAGEAPPFSWAVGSVPRRMIHVAYLAHSVGEPLATARKLVAPAAALLCGDADFEQCDGHDLVETVLAHFYGQSVTNVVLNGDQ